MSESFKIVVPTDFSKNSLAALDWVKRFADQEDAEVHCVTVAQEPMMYMPAMGGAAVATMPSIGEVKTIAEDSIENFSVSNLSDLDTPPVTKVLTGRPAEEIAAYAKSIDAEMIVMATRGQSGLAHMLLGSTAEGVVRQAECAVLTVRS